MRPATWKSKSKATEPDVFIITDSDDSEGDSKSIISRAAMRKRNSVRKSARLQKIRAPSVRISLSPDHVWRKTRIQAPRPAQESSDVDSSNDIDHEAGRLQTTVKIDRTKYDESMLRSNSSCWLCRIKHVKCKPRTDSCHSCVRAATQCLGKGQRIPSNMRGKGGSERYVSEYRLRPIGKQIRQAASPQRRSRSPLRHFIGSAASANERRGRRRRRSSSASSSPPRAGPSHKEAVRILPAGSSHKHSNQVRYGYRKSAPRTEVGPSRPEVAVSPELGIDWKHADQERSLSPDYIMTIGSSSPKPNASAGRIVGKWKDDPERNDELPLNVAQFLRHLDLGHKVHIFHQLHLRSDRDLRALSDNIDDAVRREELWRLLESKGLSIIDWWAIVKALSAL